VVYCKHPSKHPTMMPFCFLLYLLHVVNVKWIWPAVIPLPTYAVNYTILIVNVGQDVTGRQSFASTNMCKPPFSAFCRGMSVYNGATVIDISDSAYMCKPPFSAFCRGMSVYNGWLCLSLLDDVSITATQMRVNACIYVVIYRSLRFLGLEVNNENLTTGRLLRIAFVQCMHAFTGQ
jgi:hypothetical protein